MFLTSSQAVVALLRVMTELLPTTGHPAFPYVLGSCEAGSFIPSTVAALRCKCVLLQALPAHRLRFLSINLVTCLRLVHILDMQGRVCRLLEIFGSPLSKGRRQPWGTQAFNPLLLHPHQRAVLWLAGLGHFFKGQNPGKLGQLRC